MDHTYIEANQVVDRYLLGQLPAEQAEQFEEHYLGCHECLDQLELGESLQRGLKRALVEDAAHVAIVHRVRVLAWLAGLTPRPRIGLGVVALLLLLAPAAVLFLQLRDSDQRLHDAYAPQLLADRVSIGPTRSLGPANDEPEHVVRLTSAPEWVLITLELGEREAEIFRVVLSNDERELWRRDGVPLDTHDALDLSLHSSWLEAGDYVAQVESSTEAGNSRVVARFRFRVIRAD